MRVRLDIAYDGTSFAGWAAQPGLRTVQGTLEHALATVLRIETPPRLVVAGRTDAGVHATGQVAHADLDARVSPADLDRLATRLASVLAQSPDVVVRRVSEAPADFDARFSAVGRRYIYRVADWAESRDPLERHRTVWTTTPLDLDLVNSAATSLIGLRDFGAFCKSRAGATSIRDLQEFSWQRDSTGTLVAVLQADAFCHSMVRALVGACVAVGCGKLDQQSLRVIRDEARRTSAFKVMPAHGLVLTEVLYPPESELGKRAEQTRAKRQE